MYINILCGSYKRGISLLIRRNLYACLSYIQQQKKREKNSTWMHVCIIRIWRRTRIEHTYWNLFENIRRFYWFSHKPKAKKRSAFGKKKVHHTLLVPSFCSVNIIFGFDLEMGRFALYDHLFSGKSLK